jgi:thymidine phosphorylase
MAKSENLAKGGIKSELDVRKASESLAGETLVPNLINRATSIANHVWRKMRGKIDQSTAIEVATEMLFPGKAADALAKAYAQQQRRQTIGNAINAPFAATYNMPAAANMLAPGQQNQNNLNQIPKVEVRGFGAN